MLFLIIGQRPKMTEYAQKASNVKNRNYNSWHEGLFRSEIPTFHVRNCSMINIFEFILIYCKIILIENFYSVCMWRERGISFKIIHSVCTYINNTDTKLFVFSEICLELCFIIHILIIQSTQLVMLFVCIIICLQKKTLLLWFRKFLLHHEMSSTFPSWGHKHLSKNGMNEHQAAIFTWTFDILRATHCVHFSTQASWNQNLEKLNVIIKT